MPALGKQPGRRHRRAAINGAQVFSEKPERPITVSPGGGLGGGRLGCPFYGQICGHAGRSVVLGEPDKLSKQAIGQAQFKSESAAQGQIIFQMLIERLHATPPGQG